MKNVSIEDNSVLVLFSGNAPLRLGDEYYPFAVDRNFYYVTNIDKPNLIYMEKNTDGNISHTLFAERFDEVKAKWVGGVISAQECKRLSGIDDVKYIDQFEEEFSSAIFSNRITNIYIDLENRSFKAERPSLKLAQRITENYPHIKITDCYDMLAQMRNIKDEEEISNIKKAIEITKDGLYMMMKNSRAGMYEYEIEAYFDFVLKSKGVRDKAFATIAASGKNSVILHYSDNNCRTNDNDLLLVDCGASYNNYSGDITRTFPVNGKFTQRQKQIYSIVLEGQKKVISAIKPDVPYRQLNEILKAFYAQRLKEIGLINTDDEVSRYYYHSVSHQLGLETHDAGRRNSGILKAGMVITVEPGLYIVEENIGIRIEDDVLVTENGCEVLSKDIIKEIDDIEKLMNE